MCEQILRGLPQWFGIESAIVEYAAAVRTMTTLVADDGGNLIGFLTIRAHNDAAAEVHVMAVRAEWHRRGAGSALLDQAESLLRKRGIRLLQVKTLGPSRPDPHYERTREFYRRAGFLPLEENRLWGDANPCLVMVKPL